MGTDYAAVMTAVAAHLWLQPAYLHRAVISMESAMNGLESTVDDADDRLRAQVRKADSWLACVVCCTLTGLSSLKIVITSGGAGTSIGGAKLSTKS